MFFVDIDTLMKRVTDSINGLYYVVSASKAKQIQFKDKHSIYQYPTKIKTFNSMQIEEGYFVGFDHVSYFSNFNFLERCIIVSSAN